MTSCSEWTGVPLSVLLNECGLQKEASWLVSEGADPGKFSHTLPLAKAMEDVIVAYGQNGEPLRVEQGSPIRLLVPGWEAPFSVKYLRHIKVVDQPYHAWNEAMNHSIPRADLGGKSRWYHFQFGPKSVITRPSGGLTLSGRGYVQITGLAWSGGGIVKKVDVSTDGGKTWKEAKLQSPVLPRAHTRFTFDWAWDGIPCLLLTGLGTEKRRCSCLVARMNWMKFSRREQSCIRTGASARRNRKNPPAPFTPIACNPGRWLATGAYTMQCSLRLRSIYVPAI
jgi:sulfane dehydrogenase subunit SoxC